jgi:hypothetical protein
MRDASPTHQPIPTDETSDIPGRRHRALKIGSPASQTGIRSDRREGEVPHLQVMQEKVGRRPEHTVAWSMHHGWMIVVQTLHERNA